MGYQITPRKFRRREAFWPTRQIGNFLRCLSDGPEVFIIKANFFAAKSSLAFPKMFSYLSIGSILKFVSKSIDFSFLHGMKAKCLRLEG